MSIVWRERVRLTVIIAFVANCSLYIVRLFLHKQFYEDHYSIMVICAEIGFVISIAELILAPNSLRPRLAVAIVTASCVTAYLWFSDIAFWVMVK
jgi:hypothetical protein